MELRGKDPRTVGDLGTFENLLAGGEHIDERRRSRRRSRRKSRTKAKEGQLVPPRKANGREAKERVGEGK